LNLDRLIAHFDRLAEAPAAIDHFRRLIIALGVRGKLTARVSGGNASANRSQRKEIDAGMRALLESRPKYRWRPDTDSQPAPCKDGWCRARIGDTGLYINGVAFKPTDWRAAGRPIIRIQNLSGVSTEFNYTERDLEDDNAVAPGDLLVSWSATLDAFIWTGPEGALNQHIFKVVPNAAAVSPRFLYWLLKHEIRVLAESQHAHGLAMMHINRGPFLAHNVLLPPLEEQHQIAARVDQLITLCNQLDTAQAERERWRESLAVSSLRLMVAKKGARAARFAVSSVDRIVTKPTSVTALRDAIVQAAIRGSLTHGSTSETEAPTMRLGDVVVGLRYGTSRKCVYDLGSGVPVLRIPNIKNQRISLDDLKFGPLEPSEVEILALEDGDILLVRSNGSLNLVGRAARVDGAAVGMCYAGYLIRARPNRDLVDPSYLVMALNSPDCREQIEGPIRSAVGLKNINTKELSALMLRVPSLHEQRRTVALVSELIKVCDELERSLRAVQTGRTRLLEALVHESLAEDIPATPLPPIPS
jgi:type I restriction enzyme, S subunit